MGQTHNIAKPIVVSSHHVIPTVILATALVPIYDVDGGLIIARALLDSGLGTSFISERLMRQLKLVRSPCDVSITTVGEAKIQKASGCIKLRIGIELDDGQGPLNVDALIMGRVVGNLPHKTISIPPDFYKDHPIEEFADPRWHVPGDIDLLLGADVYHSFVR